MANYLDWGMNAPQVQPQQTLNFGNTPQYSLDFSGAQSPSLYSGYMTDPSAGSNLLSGWNVQDTSGITPSFGQRATDFASKNGTAMLGGLQALGGLWSAYNGMQQTKLAKQSLSNSIAQWNKNYNNQVSTYNTQLEGKAQARYNANNNNPTAAEYMAKNRLK